MKKKTHLYKLKISKFTKHYYKAIDLWITDMMQADIAVDLSEHIEEDNQNQQTYESKTYDSLSALSLSLVCMQLEHLQLMLQMQIISILESKTRRCSNNLSKMKKEPKKKKLILLVLYIQSYQTSLQSC